MMNIPSVSLFLLLPFIVGSCTFLGKSSSKPFIEVKSRPTRARVIINDQVIGQTPLVLSKEDFNQDDLQSSLKMEVQKKDFKSHSFQLKPSPGTIYHIELSKNHDGKLTLLKKKVQDLESEKEDFRLKLAQEQKKIKKQTYLKKKRDSTVKRSPASVTMKSQGLSLPYHRHSESHYFKSVVGDLLLAQNLLIQGQFVQAKKILLEIEAKYPKTPYLFSFLAHLELEQGKRDTAKIYLNKALKLNKDDLYARRLIESIRTPAQKNSENFENE